MIASANSAGLRASSGAHARPPPPPSAIRAHLPSSSAVRAALPSRWSASWLLLVQAPQPLRARVEALGQLLRAVRHSRRRGLALIGLSNNQPAPARPVEPICAGKEIE